MLAAAVAAVVRVGAGWVRAGAFVPSHATRDRDFAFMEGENKALV